MSENEPGGEYPGREAYDSVEKEAAQRGEEAEERMGRMKEMAFDEALELNKQYDELWTQKEQAGQVLADFRGEKLGMEEPKEEVKERTRETEIQRNVEAWKIRARILELDMDEATIEAEVRAAIGAVPEKEAKELGEEVAYEVMLKGVTPSQMLKLAKEHSRYYEWDEMDKYFDTQKLPRSNKEESYAIAYAFQQEPDQDSLGEKAKSAEGWEKTSDEYMSLPERVLAGASWKQEKGSELDEKNITLAAGSRSRHGDVSLVYFDSADREVSVCGCGPEHRLPLLGVRRVVSKES